MWPSAPTSASGSSHRAAVGSRSAYRYSGHGSGLVAIARTARNCITPTAAQRVRDTSAAARPRPLGTN